ncbi:hypothetical protein B0F90DRAFT_280064 [Multifurca ochricompacta]|uniref:Uncharacterized protein n=1 Tax=Multifurca ochricompacta TaxID=376703 RepID=A0AAD4QJL7_9AGAM|nr:hypothetical protein B0F90DRAFT_280064 [Multifurca ochricompacta]
MKIKYKKNSRLLICLARGMRTNWQVPPLPHFLYHMIHERFHVHVTQYTRTPSSGGSISLPDVDRGYDIYQNHPCSSSSRGLYLLSLRCIRIWEENQEEIKPILTGSWGSQMLQPSTIWLTEVLFGHSTSGYIAYDVASTKLVYPKDFWHIGTTWNSVQFTQHIVNHHVMYTQRQTVCNVPYFS